MCGHMKRYSLLLLAAFTLAACTGQKGRVIFRPDPGQARHQEPINPIESWQIVGSENGLGETGIPDWVRRYFNGNIYGVETIDRFSGKYVFVGGNRGENIHALQQWANGFTAQHDLPRLVTARVERRLVSSASLYPDDEYGQYFEMLIKAVSDGEYPGAVKEETFWVKRKMIPTDTEDGDQPLVDTVMELYEFLVLISIDRETLQKQLREIMAGIQTPSRPTRDQAAAINRIQQTFFEGF